MSIEISVKVSNDEQKLVKKFLFYPQKAGNGLEKSLFLSKDDPELRNMVEDAVKSFKGDVDDVSLTIKMNGW